MAKVTTSDFLTVHEAGNMIGVSSDTIRRWHKKGLIKAKIGAHGERLFSNSEISRTLNKSSLADTPWEILTASKGKATVIELFCGTGGLALGLHNAGLKAELLVDFDKDSIATLQRNRPEWNSICKSVSDL
jgi:DNA (cytosine-5)-methyltransferase 1